MEGARSHGNNLMLRRPRTEQKKSLGKGTMPSATVELNNVLKEELQQDR
jgi:hypothetical protein